MVLTRSCSTSVQFVMKHLFRLMMRVQLHLLCCTALHFQFCLRPSNPRLVDHRILVAGKKTATSGGDSVIVIKRT